MCRMFRLCSESFNRRRLDELNGYRASFTLPSDMLALFKYLDPI
jgi:hypothetical protein